VAVLPPGDDAPAPLATAADLDACHAAIRVGSRTFHAASRLLPERVRGPALSLYAFCREADDAIDQSGEPRAALRTLEDRLDRAYRRDPIDNAADRALADVVAKFQIPHAVPAALLEGFAWDAEGRVYDDLPALRAYAMRVAGTVGVMMSLLMGVRSPGALARAADLGVGMQLSNIARDVGEDARLGRVYLPRDWLREAGIDAEEWLSDPQFEPDLGRIVSRLVGEAQALYERAAVGVAELPPECRPAIHAARLMYAEIGRKVARAGGDSVSSRAVVSVRRKLLVLAQAITASVTAPRAAGSFEVLPEARFLLDAVAEHDLRHGVCGDALVGENLLVREFALALSAFERLERQDRDGVA
jgi:phytoene synthase